MLSWATLVLILLTWLTLTFLTSILKRTRFSPKRLPPGPIPLPVVGNLLSLGTKPHVSLATMARAHGGLMTLLLGRVTTVVVSSAEVAKLVLQKHDTVFGDRTVSDSHTVFGHSDASVVLLPLNERWRTLRKICMTQVFSHSRIDASCGLRHQKVQQLLSYVQECCEGGKAVNIGEAAFATSLNVLTNTFFSMDMVDLRSKKGSELKQLVWSIMEEAGNINIADLYPMLKFADPQGFRARMLAHVTSMFKIYEDIIEERLKMRGENAHVAEEKDVLDALINIANQEGTGFELSDIRHLFLDLIVAGTDTTSSTIEWAMAELLLNQSKLNKAKAELREVIGQENAIEKSDSAHLPYLHAVVKETLRLHPPVPFLIPRKVNVDIELYDYTIPKNAQVFVNVWAMGRDESVWKDAESFEPERFLDSGLDYKGRDFEFLPFGAGRRICPGLPLGQRMLYLELGTLIHGFDWKLEDKLSREMYLEEKFGFTLQKARPLLAIPTAI